ncbi:MAG: imelysin family protein [Bacteroidota bacterium]
MNYRASFKNWTFWPTAVLVVLVSSMIFTACGDEEEPDDQGPTETDFTNLLTNQVDNVIIPSVEDYQQAMLELDNAVAEFSNDLSQANLSFLRTVYLNAYLKYQAVAVHNYFATTNQGLVLNTNLYPVDVDLLENLIESESYNFNTTAQQRANGFPAMDYLLFGPSDVLTYFNDDSKILAFLNALIDDMKVRADAIASTWKGDLRDNFIGNGGTALGSSISVQLNESLLYYEIHIRENKVGIPIGRLGPNDSPIPADDTKIEAFYQSMSDGGESITLSLLRAAIEEMEDLYLGTTASGSNGQGYDDLLIARDQAAIDTDIKAQFAAIYAEIGSRTSISGDEELYNTVQQLVTLYKSDLFPILNVQDADGMSDGD